jgi:oxygen-dependent protoporphyrinogen oxidase
MQQLTDTLAARLEGRVRRIAGAVERVERSGGGYRLFVGGEALAAEEVVLATPAYRAALLLRGLEEKLADLLAAVPYNSSITAALLYPRAEFEHPLDGFGFLVPRAENRALTACTWVNTKFPYRAAGNRVLLRAFFAAERAERCAGPEEQIAETAHRELSGLMKYRQQPVTWRVQRWERAMAQYEVGHQKRQREIDERTVRLPGLWLTGNAYIGIGIPDCIRRSRQVADAITRSTPLALQ